MSSEVLKVDYFFARDCFVYLPKVWLSYLDLNDCAVKIEKDGGEIYASCLENSRMSSSKTLNVSAKFGKCLGLEIGDEVLVSILKNSPVLSSITVEADSDEDYEIISIQSERLQSIILNQISIVSINQPFIIYLSRNLSVKMTVTSTTPPFHFGKLQQDTEVHVLLKSSAKSTKNGSNPSKNSRIALFDTNKQRNPLFRVCLSPKIQDFCFENTSDEVKTFYNVFINRFQRENFFSTTDLIYCKLKKLSKDFPSVDSKHSPVIVQVKVLENVLPNFDDFNDVSKNSSNIFICKTLQKNLELNFGDKIYLEEILITERILKNLEISTTIESFNFEDYLHQNFPGQKVLINPGITKVFLADGSSFSINQTEDSHGLLEESALGNTKISTKFDPEETTNHSLENCSVLNSVDSECFETLIKNCSTLLRMSLSSFFDKNFICDRVNVVICGESGSGKSTVCQLLESSLQNCPFWCYTQKVDCKKLKGKKVEMISKHLQSILFDCKFKQPSVLILDDLDSITNVSSGENEENSAESTNAKKTADAVVDLVTTFQKNDWISIIATCSSLDRLGPQFELTRGVKLFRSILKLPGLTKDHRLRILRKILMDRFHQNVDLINWATVANKTEGWLPQDLVDLAEKAVFSCWKHQQQRLNQHQMEMEDVNLALETLKPAALHGVSLFNGSGYQWSDIGGLFSVKQSLIQLLQWPLKYPGLFKNSPIKEQSGVLLFGMPGTGKTLLAGAVAKECGLNFISIKGPELLSKYIGASEEAVRTIFEKAQRAKPCVLFFDEFESLAPRRGNDSTGVTDRVVNQLLTQFDGVEGREGVAIIAASSRPDLLDPALLRPGRLDKSLLCPLPNQADRVEILTSLCRKYSMDTSNLDLNKIATISEGFSGADLNAVLNQARLNVFNSNYSDKDGKNQIVTEENLLESLHSTQPSLTIKQIVRFNQIYSQFVGSIIDPELLKPKATLA